MQVLFEIMVQNKQKGGIGVESPPVGSFSGGVVQICMTYIFRTYIVAYMYAVVCTSIYVVHIYIVAYIYIVYAQHMYDIPMPAQDAKNHTMAVHERSNCPLEPSCESKYKSE